MIEDVVHVVWFDMSSVFGFASDPRDWLFTSHSVDDWCFIFINSWNWLWFIYTPFSICDINGFNWNNRDSFSQDKGWILSIIKCFLACERFISVTWSRSSWFRIPKVALKSFRNISWSRSIILIHILLFSIRNEIIQIWLIETLLSLS